MIIITAVKGVLSPTGAHSCTAPLTRGNSRLGAYPSPLKEACPATQAVSRQNLSTSVTSSGFSPAREVMSTTLELASDQSIQHPGPFHGWWSHVKTD